MISKMANQTLQAVTSSQSHSESKGHLSLETLLAILILLIYTISAPLFETYHFHYIHESGVCMIIGFLLTLAAILVNPDANFAMGLHFDQEIFFTFILPPIIFAAGYNLRRKTFFKYFLYIFMFGVIGTLTSFLIVAPLTMIANYYELFSLSFEEGVINLSVKEILMFASVISATDTVAALTFVKEESEPKLFSILFGEGVVNDAVCIVLYRIIKQFTESNEEFSAGTPVKMLFKFVSLFSFSLIIGVLGGILCALFLKKLKHINMNRVQETCIIIFFAFISYTLTEELGFSPIIALLFAGIMMSQYAFFNLSFQAREESSVVSRIMSNIAEAFVFTYLGLTFLTSIKKKFSFSFIIWEILFVMAGRFSAIYGVSYLLANVFKMSNFKISDSDKGIMSFAGSIRGAIAFGLAISIDTPNKEILISGTLVLVFFTTIIFGALMPAIFKFFKGGEKSENHEIGNEESQFQFLNPNTDNPIKEFSQEEIEKRKMRISYKIGAFWRRIDEQYIKPYVIYGYPNSINEHEEISNGIKTVMEESRRRRIKKKISNIEVSK